MTMGRLGLLVLIALLARGAWAQPAPKAGAKAPSKPAVSKATDADEDEDDEDDDDEDSDSSAAEAPKSAKKTTGAARPAVANPENKSDEESDDESHEDEDDEDDGEIDWRTINANVDLTSNYMLRGYTQTDNQPAVQGGFDWQHPLGFDASAWGSNVHFPGSSTSLELDMLAGYSHTFPIDLTTRLGGVYYWYFQDSPRNSWDVQASAEWRGFKAEVDFSPKWEGTNQHSWYFNLGWTDEVKWGLKPGAFAGYSLYPQGSFFPSYADFKISLAYDFLGLTWEAAGVFTKVQRLTQTETIVDPDDEDLTTTRTTQIVYGGSKAVFTVTKTF